MPQRPRQRPADRATVSEQTRAIRQWAFDQGYEISERCLIPVSIEETYTAAH
ncbi:histone-like nucleoid-structuring protein Lsr2 [Rhodococcus sp. UYP9]|uniref:Lsr2 family DNA-binding protein n=1 Tax=Rhodococcus sp. UYP9 TaxID=1756407 RepID=UPI003397B43A